MKIGQFFGEENADKKELDSIFSRVESEKNSNLSGYYNLPFESAALESAKAYAKANKDFLQHIHNIVVIGIGGSSLGVKAIDSLLCHLPERNQRVLKCLEHTDPIKIAASLKKIALKDTLFVLISKSGTTIETTSLLKFVLHKYNILGDFESKKHLISITDYDSPLQKWCESQSVEFINIAKNIGGRFSVLSSVGIFPLSLLGYDVAALLEGARQFSSEFFARKQEHVLQKARFLASHRHDLPINILFSYSSSFKNFNAWFVQLWGESLGKIDTRGESVGLTPISLIGSIDQHSFLQLIIQGPRDKVVTFISVEHSDAASLEIPRLSLRHLESTDFVNGVSFGELLNTQQRATMEALIAQNIPTDYIRINCLNEQSMGELISYFELLTSSVGVIFDINTYDQPGVELGKIRLKELFGGGKVK